MPAPTPERKFVTDFVAAWTKVMNSCDFSETRGNAFRFHLVEDDQIILGMLRHYLPRSHRPEGKVT
jgi:hypothetical protein